MKIILTSCLVVCVLSCAASLRIVRPTRGCEKCKQNQKCVKIIPPINCIRAPCPQHKCVDVKPGTCPIMSQIYSKRCFYDEHCPDDKKCCSGRCATPVNTVRPGRCPFEKAICPVAPPPSECQDDGDCLRPKKCCGGCYKRCLLPMRKEGQCPRVLMPNYQCTHDYDCPGKEKCCRGNCVKPNPCGICKPGYICLPMYRYCKKPPCPTHSCVYISKPGICPVSRRPCIKRPNTCQNDYDCKRSYKCCLDECSRKVCQRPISWWN